MTDLVMEFGSEVYKATVTPSLSGGIEIRLLGSGLPEVVLTTQVNIMPASSEFRICWDECVAVSKPNGELHINTAARRSMEQLAKFMHFLRMTAVMFRRKYTGVKSHRLSERVVVELPEMLAVHTAMPYIEELVLSRLELYVYEPLAE